MISSNGIDISFYSDNEKSSRLAKIDDILYVSLEGDSPFTMSKIYIQNQLVTPISKDGGLNWLAELTVTKFLDSGEVLVFIGDLGRPGGDKISQLYTTKIVIGTCACILKFKTQLAHQNFLLQTSSILYWTMFILNATIL